MFYRGWTFFSRLAGRRGIKAKTKNPKLSIKGRAWICLNILSSFDFEAF